MDQGLTMEGNDDEAVVASATATVASIAVAASSGGTTTTSHLCQVLSREFRNMERALRCSLCLTTFPTDQACMLQGCIHSFCRACLNEAFQKHSSRQCPLCKQPCTRRSVVANPQLGQVVNAFKQCVRRFGLAPTVHVAQFEGMTQLPPEADDDDEGDVAESDRRKSDKSKLKCTAIHQDLLASRTLLQHVQDKEQAQIVDLNEAALVDAASRAGSDIQAYQKLRETRNQRQDDAKPAADALRRSQDSVVNATQSSFHTTRQEESYSQQVQNCNVTTRRKKKKSVEEIMDELSSDDEKETIAGAADQTSPSTTQTNISNTTFYSADQDEEGELEPPASLPPTVNDDEPSEKTVKKSNRAKSNDDSDDDLMTLESIKSSGTRSRRRYRGTFGSPSPVVPNSSRWVEYAPEPVIHSRKSSDAVEPDAGADDAASTLAGEGSRTSDDKTSTEECTSTTSAPASAATADDTDDAKDGTAGTSRRSTRHSAKSATADKPSLNGAGTKSSSKSASERAPAKVATTTCLRMRPSGRKSGRSSASATATSKETSVGGDSEKPDPNESKAPGAEPSSSLKATTIRRASSASENPSLETNSSKKVDAAASKQAASAATVDASVSSNAAKKERENRSDHDPNQSAPPKRNEAQEKQRTPAKKTTGDSTEAGVRGARLSPRKRLIEPSAGNGPGSSPGHAKNPSVSSKPAAPVERKATQSGTGRGRRNAPASLDPSDVPKKAKLAAPQSATDRGRASRRSAPALLKPMDIPKKAKPAAPQSTTDRDRSSRRSAPALLKPVDVPKKAVADYESSSDDESATLNKTSKRSLPNECGNDDRPSLGSTRTSFGDVLSIRKKDSTAKAKNTEVQDKSAATALECQTSTTHPDRHSGTADRRTTTTGTDAQTSNKSEPSDVKQARVMPKSKLDDKAASCDNAAGEQNPPAQNRQSTAATTKSTVTSGASCRSFEVGAIVEVQARTWPGMNKPGGVARITKVHETTGSGNNAKVAISYDVAYVVGRAKEQQVDAIFVRMLSEKVGSFSNTMAPPEDARKRARRQKVSNTNIAETNRKSSYRLAAVKQEAQSRDDYLPPDLLAKLKAEGFDTTGSKPSVRPRKRAKVSADVKKGDSLTMKKENIEPSRDRKRTSEDSSKASASPPQKKRKGAGLATVISKVLPKGRKKANMTEVAKDAERAGKTESPLTDEQACDEADKFYARRLATVFDSKNSKGVHVIASSLSEKEMKALKTLCQSTKQGPVKVKLSDQFQANRTTICLVPAVARCEAGQKPFNLVARNRRVKSMLAALKGVPIVDAAWISDCQVSKTSTVNAPPASMFVRTLPAGSSGSSSGPDFGVARQAARLHRNKAFRLLNQHFVYMSGDFTHQLQTDILVLLREAGATVLTNSSTTSAQIRNSASGKKTRVVFLIAGGPGNPIGPAMEAEILRHPENVILVNVQWLFDSISQGSPLEARAYKPDCAKNGKLSSLVEVTSAV